MKKRVISLIKILFLTVHIIVFTGFAFCIFFDLARGVRVSNDVLEAAFVISLIFLFAAAIKSVVFSKIIKLDLSYKGPDTFDFLSKWVKILSVFLALIGIVLSLILKLHFYFILTIIINTFSIVYQLSVLKYFRSEK